RVSEQHDPRASIATTEEPLPRVLHVVCHRIDEIRKALFGGRRAQRAGGSNALTGRGIAAAEKGEKIHPRARPQKPQKDEPRAAGATPSPRFGASSIAVASRAHPHLALSACVFLAASRHAATARRAAPAPRRGSASGCGARGCR